MSLPFPKSKEELVKRLQNTPRKIKLISASEYKDLLRLSSFKCPKPRQIIARCDGKACPTRPYPCESCNYNKKWMKVFNSKRKTYLEKRDEAWDELMSHCEGCNFETQWRLNNDYYDECIRSRNARNQLVKVNEGRIQVKESGWGVQR